MDTFDEQLRQDDKDLRAAVDSGRLPFELVQHLSARHKGYYYRVQIRKPTTTLILEIMKEEKDNTGLDSDAILKALFRRTKRSYNRATINMSIQSLFKGGKVRRVGRGVYKHVDH